MPKVRKIDLKTGYYRGRNWEGADKSHTVPDYEIFRVEVHDAGLDRVSVTINSFDDLPNESCVFEYIEFIDTEPIEMTQ